MGGVATSPGSAARRALRRPAVRLVALFSALSAAVFGIPAALGATWLVGDNLIQNFPLRVLVGDDLRSGHLPLWDPYLWSGSPLLSAFNAGAAYPTTWLFAILPGALAWVVNQALVEVVAAAGMLLLLRVLGRSWTAAGLGAGAFTFGGFMAAQSVHLDVVQAGAWLPWAFAALDRVAHRPEGRSAAPWVALLACAVGLMGLSGAAEPILDGAVVLSVYALWLLVRTRGRRLAVFAGSVAGAGIGLLLAGIQLVPGALIQSQSQRAVHDYAYFVSGSMNKSLTVLGLDPFIFGGIHQIPLSYFATYNLPELSSYIGILPVMGLFGLLARRHRRSPEAPNWRIWYGLVVLGLLLTWGGFTPLGHLFFHLPLFDRQRLLARNLLEVDLAVAVLFAAWVDHMLLAPVPDPSPDGGPPVGPGPGAGPGRRWWGLRSDVVLPLLPVVGVIGLQIVMLAGGTWFPHLVHAPGHVTRSSLWPLVAFLTVPSAIAAAAAIVVVRRQRLRRLMPRLLTVVMVVDLVVFNVGVQQVPDVHAASSASATWANQLAALVAAQGEGAAGGRHRVGFFDPDRYYPVQVDQLGEPDLTVLRSLPSVQGYGAVVAAAYDLATGTHLQLNMTPAALGDGTLSRLDLAVMATVPEYFVHLVVPPATDPSSIATGATRLPPVGPSPSAPPETAAPPPTPTGDYEYAPHPAPALTLQWDRPLSAYLGTELDVTSITVPVSSAPSGALVRVGVTPADGGPTVWLGDAVTAAGAASLTVTAARPQPAVGVVLEASDSASGLTLPASPRIGALVVRTAGQGTYRLDGALRDAVSPPRWHFAGMFGPFCVFTEGASGLAWLQDPSGGSARIVSNTSWGSETIRVHTDRPATLVRNEQFASGWQATVTASHGGSVTSRAAKVRRDGLVQSVSVPAGTSTVSFVYRPHRVLEGMAATVLGLLALVALTRWPAVRRRWARRRS